MMMMVEVVKIKVTTEESDGTDGFPSNDFKQKRTHSAERRRKSGDSGRRKSGDSG